ncbi:hypothetical protein GYMLUDRAFT_60819 [Collybiopsis luxurians FD-317 M1]|uniref:Uncharacterized protein n=1 Tax=Collybiopsis luxurians FD-317 M1 TaxID=944289 RepID=A0A0D0BSC9_9AGAR|nr:hypothetical protein GYMLUDRAFT_60819 [Collybiopsis luxurians FD-317 M1]
MRLTSAITSTYLALALGCFLPLVCRATPISPRHDLISSSERATARALDSTHQWDTRAPASPSFSWEWVSQAGSKPLPQSKQSEAAQLVTSSLERILKNVHDKRPQKQLLTFNPQVQGPGRTQPALVAQPNGQKRMSFDFKVGGLSMFEGWVSESLQMGEVKEKGSKKVLLAFNNNKFNLEESGVVAFMQDVSKADGIKS